MDSLRWILLGAGAIFVLVIYILGRSRKSRNHSIVDDLEGDLPEFSANSLDDVDEGVGSVRVVASDDPDPLMDSEPAVGSGSVPTSSHAAGRAEPEVNAGLQDAARSAIDPPRTDSSISGHQQGRNQAPASADLVVLYILPRVAPKGEELLNGAQINSAAQAMGLKFGDMSIYHFRRNERNVFSMANMLEPGYFDPDTMHDLKTRGLTIFMQMQEENPMDDLTEMLQRSYQLAGLLDARLCNHKRTPLTEQDAEDYRDKVRAFLDSKSFELSVEE